MGRRRGGNDIEGLIAPIAVLLFLFGAAIIAILKVLLLWLLVAAGSALACLMLYRLGRKLWERQLNLAGYLPAIDWTLPAIPNFDTGRVALHYPEFTTPPAPSLPHVIGTSGAWKEVTRKLDGFPGLRSASDPRDLQQRISRCEAAIPDVLRRALATADAVVRTKKPELEQQLEKLREAEPSFVDGVQQKLDTLSSWIDVMKSGSVIERFKARRMDSCLAQYIARLASLRQELRARVAAQEQAICDFLDPSQMERVIRNKLEQDLALMKAVKGVNP